MAKKTPKMSEAQARKLAWFWSEDKLISVPRSSEAYILPTIKALLKYGWIEPTGQESVVYDAIFYRVSTEGLDALEEFFRWRRYARTPPLGAQSGNVALPPPEQGRADE